MLTYVLIPLAAAAPLAAQFEGTINMTVSNANANTGDMHMKIMFKGDKQVTAVTMPATAGPMAGMEMRAIMDTKTLTVTNLIPLPPGMAAMTGNPDAKGMKMVMDLSKATEGAPTDKAVQIKKLGTTKKIAGVDCEDYEFSGDNGKPMKACITSSLGRFVFPQMGGMGRGRGSGPPAWAKAFGDRPAFPLKVWSDDGSVAMEVTSVERGSVPASVFEIPDGYVDMSGVMRGRSGGL